MRVGSYQTLVPCSSCHAWDRVGYLSFYVEDGRPWFFCWQCDSHSRHCRLKGKPVMKCPGCMILVDRDEWT